MSDSINPADLPAKAFIPKTVCIPVDQLDHTAALRKPGWKEAVLEKSRKVNVKGADLLILSLEDAAALRKEFNPEADSSVIERNIRAFKDPGFETALDYVFSKSVDQVDPKFEDLRQAYLAELAAMGGEDCSGCSLTKLKSQYRDRLTQRWDMLNEIKKSND